MSFGLHEESQGVIDVVLDLHQLQSRVENSNDLCTVWKELAVELVGMPVSVGEWRELTGPKGVWRLLFLEGRGQAVVGNDTAINVVDVKRPPTIRHVCKDHYKLGKKVFGPFLCAVCREAGSAYRLCESHAYFLENRYTAYCSEHLPRCQCRADCADAAAFECSGCRKAFSEGWKKTHPGNPLTLFCRICYDYRFETCSECASQNRRRLGKSRCSFPVGPTDNRHAKRLCTYQHARQWQIWGPHWRGVILCNEHDERLSQSNPSELLWMMVTAQAPAPFLRNRLKDMYRLRNIISYCIRREFSWQALQLSLEMLLKKAGHPSVSSRIRKDLNDLLAICRETIIEKQKIEAQLLARARQFYKQHLRVPPEEVIRQIEVKRIFGFREKEKSYNVVIHVTADRQGRSRVGLLIGTGGALLKQLQAALNLQKVDFSAGN